MLDKKEEEEETSTFSKEELIESEVDETDEENEIVEFDDDTNKTKENFYKYAKKTDESDDEDTDEDTDDIILSDTVKSIYIDSKDRTSKPILTLYEEVRIVSERAKQLSLGAKPMIKNVDNLSSKEIAELELKHNVIPFTILRPQPNGYIEVWKISELAH